MDNRDEFAICDDTQIVGAKEVILNYLFSNKTTIEGEVVPDVLYVRTTPIKKDGTALYKRLCYIPRIAWSFVEEAASADPPFPDYLRKSLLLYKGDTHTPPHMPILAIKGYTCEEAVNLLSNLPAL